MAMALHQEMSPDEINAAEDIAKSFGNSRILRFYQY
jgi:hypothetical protein